MILITVNMNKWFIIGGLGLLALVIFIIVKSNKKPTIQYNNTGVVGPQTVVENPDGTYTTPEPVFEEKPYDEYYWGKEVIKYVIPGAFLFM